MGRKSKADVRKKEILQHFYQVLIEEGFENASIAKIAKKMEVNPSLLIHYFQTKEEMVVDLVDFILNNYEERFTKQLESIETPQQRFDAVIDIMFGAEWLEISNRTVFYACYYLTTRHERILVRFRELYDTFENFLIEEAKSWIEHKIIPDHHDPKQVAELLIVMNEGTTYYEGIRRNKEAYLKRGAFIKNLVLTTLKN